MQLTGSVFCLLRCWNGTICGQSVWINKNLVRISIRAASEPILHIQTKFVLFHFRFICVGVFRSFQTTCCSPSHVFLRMFPDRVDEVLCEACVRSGAWGLGQVRLMCLSICSSKRLELLSPAGRCCFWEIYRSIDLSYLKKIKNYGHFETS